MAAHEPHAPQARWPWERSLQYRIIGTYSLVFFLILALLMARVGQVVYAAQFQEVENHLELEAFLAANAFEDPLSGYAEEFREYSRRHHNEGEIMKEAVEEGRNRGNGEGGLAPIVARLQSVAANYAMDTGARVTILDHHGNLIADSQADAADVIDAADPSSHVEIQAALNGREQHAIRPNPVTGEPTLYVAAPIQLGSEILGIVRLSRPMSQVTDRIRALLLSLVLTGLLALAAMTGIGFWLGRRLVHPLQAIEEAALAVAQGDLTRQAPVETDDELGAVAKAFNTMVRELREMMEQQKAFIANASHELRTPLTNIKLRSEALLGGAKDDPAVADRYLLEIDREVDRLARLANTLLDLSRLEAGTETDAAPEVIDVAPLLHSVGETMQGRAAQADLHLDLAIPPKLEMQVWPEHLETILINLVDNAIKYTPAGGQIRLRAWTRGAYCRIEVQDTGPGIDRENLPHIFDRFYRVDKARSRRDGYWGAGSGAGLGLSIVKTLVTRNGGKVWAESQPGAGTTFIVEFPNSSANHP
ncbi:HAMP domain-containing protein [Litorilinea aerophila]|uniref:histidine kinase n=1 Tax=Litorilinea aerophila TaxID=1204385 RepID=A0A540VDD6_9CHLR|nr:ATP-binding protein [Litorilinea aerophila]MCC9077472.1 HAMP domain-containing protein [Litorilinea aerophila]OUC05631.1 hypothetical protein RY27_26040 [Litorilinea aerophila]